MARRGDYTNVGTASDAVLAADAHVAAEGVSYEGCINLMGAMWQLVRKDLEHGGREAYQWLATSEFSRWCEVCAIEPATLRQHLIEHHWRRRAA